MKVIGCSEIIGGDEMRYFLCSLETAEVGTDQQIVYAFNDDVKEDEIDSCIHDMAIDNANSYGVLERAMEEAEEIGIEFIEDEYFSYDYEELEGMTEEDIEDQYGEIEFL